MSDKTSADTESDANALQCLTSGMIIHEGRTHLVTVCETDLVLDVVAWAVDQAQNNEQSAEAATTPEARDMFLALARDLRRWADGDPEYLEMGRPLALLSPRLAARARLGHLRVGPETFADYMSLLMQHTRPARRGAEMSFLFMASPLESEGPQIFATEKHDLIARYTPKGVYTEIVSEARLNSVYLAAMREYRMAKRVAPTGSPPDSQPLLTPQDIIARAALHGLMHGYSVPGIEISIPDEAEILPDKPLPLGKTRPRRRERKPPPTE